MVMIKKPMKSMKTQRTVPYAFNKSARDAAAVALVIAMLSGSTPGSAEATPKSAIVIKGETPSQKGGTLDQFDKSVASEEFVPLTAEERLYLYQELSKTGPDAIPVIEFKPLLDKALMELDQQRYGTIKQELIEKGHTTDPDRLDVHARWIYGVREEKMELRYLCASQVYGLLL